MKTLNIGIDIDGTLTGAYDWLPMANHYFKKSIREEDIIEYDIHKVLAISRDEYEIFYSQFGREIHKNAPIRDDVKLVLDNLYLDHRLHYITARSPLMKNVTNHWLNKHDLPITSLSLLGSHSKLSRAYELGCDIFIEDRYENALELSQGGLMVILIDTNYNRKPLPKGVTRVKTWKEVYKLIQNISLIENIFQTA